MKFIFLVDSYYPSPSPNAICIEQLKRVCVQNGDEVEIITLRNFPKNLHDRKENGVYYLDPNFLYSMYYSAVFKGKSVDFIKKIFWIRSILYGLFWPLSSITHIIRYSRKLIQLLKKKDEDVVVIGVYKSLEAAVSGAIVKKIYGRAKYYLYTLDAVSGSLIPTIFRSRKIALRAVGRWENFLFKTYDCLFLMNSHKIYYADSRYNIFRDKIQYVDIPLFTPLFNFSKKTINFKGKKVHMVFTGSFSKETADPSYFLDLLDFLDNKDLIFDIYGSIYDLYIKERINSSPYVTYHGKIDHEQILEIQRSECILLNFGNANSCAIPCKIFEYFSAMRPILSFTKSENDASLNYINKYPYALVLNENESLENNAQLLRAFIQKDFLIEVESISSAYKDNTPQFTIDNFLEKANGK